MSLTKPNGPSSSLQNRRESNPDSLFFDSELFCSDSLLMSDEDMNGPSTSLVERKRVLPRYDLTWEVR